VSKLQTKLSNLESKTYSEIITAQYIGEVQTLIPKRPQKYAFAFFSQNTTAKNDITPGRYTQKRKMTNKPDDEAP